MSIMELTEGDFEGYIGKWFAKNDPETEELRKMLSNGKKPLALTYLVKNDMVRAKLKQLGLEIIYRRKRDNGEQGMRWSIQRA